MAGIRVAIAPVTAVTTTVTQIDIPGATADASLVTTSFGIRQRAITIPASPSAIEIQNRFGANTMIGADTTPAAVLDIAGSHFPAASALGRVTRIAGTVREAGSGVHARLMGLEVTAPTITAGVATVTDAATVYISAATGATVTGTDNALWVDAGASRFDGRVNQTQGADVASANNLALGADGNAFEITGTTQINLISNLAWQNGSEITLLFTSTPTVKQAQATTGTNITILLDTAGDFVATAGDSLTLVLSEIGGTQAWRETGRARL
jgi:hypothetical protein